MEGKKSKSRALLIFGAPCSGKTTFSEKFAKKFDIAYYNFDEIRAQQRLTHKNIILIMSLLARTGKTLIFEGGLDTEKDREEVYNLLRAAGYDFSLIWIQTDVSTIKSRLKNKYKSVNMAKEVYDTTVSAMEAPTEIERPIILSGKHTFETQTKHVLAGLADANR